MVRLSNGLIAGLNVLTLAVALSGMGFSLWFHVSEGSRCEWVMKTPLLAVSSALLVVSAVGLAGALTRIPLIMWFYLAVLFLLIIALVVFTMFTVIVTNKGVGHNISARGVGNYSKWLQRYVVNAKNWDQIKSCMFETDLCRLVVDAKNTDHHFYNPTVSGCCKPPAYCGLVSKNASYWIMPKTGPAQPDPDCTTWSNDREHMCFDCDSCKKAVLANIRREWKMVALINILITIFVIIVYFVGCCALTDNQYDLHNKPPHP